MNRAATLAAAEKLRKNLAAKRIQRAFKVYYQALVMARLHHQREQARIKMAYINTMAMRIQISFKAYKARVGVAQAIMRRRRLKMIVNDLCTAWRTRRSLNCLGTEV